MNIIDKSANSVIIFTLNEKKTLTSPLYLVKATSHSGRNTKRFLLSTDQSTATDRYNQFTVTESTTEVLTSGTVNLTPAGFWDYEIYEQTSTTNLNEALCDNTTPIEKGMFLVRQSNATDSYYSTTTPENKFYGQ